MIIMVGTRLLLSLKMQEINASEYCPAVVCDLDHLDPFKSEKYLLLNTVLMMYGMHIF